MGGERGCRGVWIMIKFTHAGHVTKHTLFVVKLDICVFEVFLEGGGCSVQDIGNLHHLVSLDLPVFGMGVSEASPNCGGNIMI